MKRKKFFIISMLLILLAVGIAVLKLRPRNRGLYKVTILPTLGGNFMLPQSINDKGQIAGFSEVSKGNYHLFFWDKESGMRDLGPVENGNISINNTCQIAANFTDPNGNIRSFIYDPNIGRTTLPTLGGNRSYAYSINDKKQVVGNAETLSGDNHAFIWDALNGIIDLTPNNTKYAIAFSINNTSQITVVGINPSLLVTINEDKTISSIPIPIQGVYTINNNAYVIGYIQNGKSKLDIVTWHHDFGQKTLLRSHPNFSSYVFNDLNQLIISDEKQIRFLGRSFFSVYFNHYLVDPNLGIISLDEHVHVDRHENLALTDINNKGCIVGAIQSTKESKSVGVLFEPIPEKWNK